MSDFEDRLRAFEERMDEAGEVDVVEDQEENETSKFEEALIRNPFTDPDEQVYMCIAEADGKAYIGGLGDHVSDGICNLLYPMGFIEREVQQLVDEADPTKGFNIGLQRGVLKIHQSIGCLKTIIVNYSTLCFLRKDSDMDQDLVKMYTDAYEQAATADSNIEKPTDQEIAFVNQNG